MDQKPIFIEMSLKSWNAQVKSTNKLLDELSDEALLYEVSPGRNRVIYILGHLIAVHDNLLPLLGFGERLFPSFGEIFITSPDKSSHIFPPVSELRENWKELNSVLSAHFERMSTDEWFSKHAAVSQADFEKDPTRNKLNVLLNRTAHLAYHLGQMILVKGSVKD
jgi:hypothetical protein